MNLKRGDIGHLASAAPSSLNVRGLRDILLRERTYDPELADDLEAIQRDQPLADEAPWEVQTPTDREE